ncbi:hypothetical protein ONZ45_g14669 [Pleurotus djamor]|nr:hypothetical protein ONZ45_g14669 [Pleurotus djamor]
MTQYAYGLKTVKALEEKVDRIVDFRGVLSLPKVIATRELAHITTTDIVELTDEDEDDHLFLQWTGQGKIGDPIVFDDA